jgi:hypothetical protein
MEQTLLISQVTEILPHLGDGFVEACLIANNWNVETTIAQILNDDLPPEVASIPQSKKLYSIPRKTLR